MLNWVLNKPLLSCVKYIYYVLSTTIWPKYSMQNNFLVLIWPISGNNFYVRIFFTRLQHNSSLWPTSSFLVLKSDLTRYLQHLVLGINNNKQGIIINNGITGIRLFHLRIRQCWTVFVCYIVVCWFTSS